MLPSVPSFPRIFVQCINWNLSYSGNNVDYCKIRCTYVYRSMCAYTCMYVCVYVCIYIYNTGVIAATLLQLFLLVNTFFFRAREHSIFT